MSRSPPGKANPSVSRTGPNAIKTVAELIRSGKARQIVVLTGAGISTSAGIPDFRSPETGLYANLQALDLPFPEAVFELEYFRSNPRPFWTLAKELYPGKHFPTATHYFLKLLDDHGILKRVFSQNIDTLEQLTDLPISKIIEAHGSFASSHCLDCRKPISTEHVLESGVRRGEIVYCPDPPCGGLVKPDIVFFGEGLPDAFFDNLKDLKTCDLLIVIGTSLQVQPFSLLPHRTDRSTPRFLLNKEAVGPFQHLDKKSSNSWKADPGRKSDLFWQGDADQGVRDLCDDLGWRDELEALIVKGHAELEKKWASQERSVSSSESAKVEEPVNGKVGEEQSSGDEVGGEQGKSTVESKDSAQTSNDTGEEEAREKAEEISVKVGKTLEEDEMDDLQKAIEKDLRLNE